MNSVIVLDAGNSIIKFKRGDGRESEFVHALHELDLSKAVNLREKYNGVLPSGYAKINGKTYAYGTQAESYGVKEKLRGAARYRKDYYGVIAGIALALSYDRGGEYSLFGSHAPGDINYRENLMQAAAGTWEVEIAGKTRTYTINYANTFEEPQGGLMNVILADDGQHYKHSELNGGRALVIDIGGRTTDWLAVHPGGEVDDSLDTSSKYGIIHVTETFEELFGKTHAHLLQDASDGLPPALVRKAISTGKIKIGGKEYSCESEVLQAVNKTLNEIVTAYRSKANAGIGYDSIVLTGGGSAMLHDHLIPHLNHENVLLADDSSTIHFANVRGGLKLWKFYESEGVLD